MAQIRHLSSSNGQKFATGSKVAFRMLSVASIPLLHLEPSNTVPVDPFMLSRTTIARGVGRYLVTSVGVNSTYGRTHMSLRNDTEETPPQAKLGRLGKLLICGYHVTERFTGEEPDHQERAGLDLASQP
ncbi:hypothetical protein BGZ61DRAFT_488174 [Ilyonectria robusta]|uniref:uncharacterized protein n=1 Tax=Ilyonectria robusta TaxID=1079257 RepID=UPI001E8CDD7D|nr:uncharacterized protein BGZ61DRAFT_488174 [Ilyonectria robusta]KAH8647501.1 hypothetical protein BGZ61DRAFT_488174 [Ilyonectria robusta]